MIACKVFVAVALVTLVNLAQINGRPAENEWAIPFVNALNNLTSSLGELNGENSNKYTELTKTKYNEFVGSFKSGVDSLTKTFETKSGVPDELKEATKKWQSDVEAYNKSLPESLSPEKFTEKFQKSLNYITEQSTNLWKKAQGNPEFEKDIQDFTKTHIDALLAKVESVKNKLSEKQA